jgi:hypothetical protein
VEGRGLNARWRTGNAMLDAEARANERTRVRERVNWNAKERERVISNL